MLNFAPVSLESLVNERLNYRAYSDEKVEDEVEEKGNDSWFFPKQRERPDDLFKMCARLEALHLTVVPTTLTAHEEKMLDLCARLEAWSLPVIPTPSPSKFAQPPISFEFDCTDVDLLSLPKPSSYLERQRLRQRQGSSGEFHEHDCHEHHHCQSSLSTRHPLRSAVKLR